MPSAACIYQGTRFNVDSASAPDTVDILLPSYHRSTFASRASPKRRRIDRDIQLDETSFSKSCLAIESSIYFRARRQRASSSPLPHAILWRILEERKVLELQAADLFHDPPQKDSERLALRLTFPDALIPSGISFAEPLDDDASDAFCVFALTRRGELFTLSFRRSAFVQPDFLDTTAAVSSDWCRSSSPSVLNVKPAHRLLATSERDLWVSLVDGSIARLQRDPNTPAGLQWQESLFTEGGWKASVRGLIPWKGAARARFGNIDLDAKTATSVVMSPNKLHIWTVCLDHTLRAWNVETGQILFQMDLGADTTRDLEKPLDQLIDPGYSDLIQLVPHKTRTEYTIVTFSPLLRRFHFWIVREPSSSMGVEPAFPDFEFTPPIEDFVNSPVWTLNSFRIQEPSTGKGKDWRLWLLLQSGSKSHCFSVTFDPSARAKDLVRAWENNWSEVPPGLINFDSLKKPPSDKSDLKMHLCPPSGAGTAERWIQYLFHSGQFTPATLDTALYVYRRGLNQNRPYGVSFSKTGQSLKERVCECVGMHARLGQSAIGKMAYEAYERDVAAQWEGFSGIVHDLERQRETTLSLAYDPHGEIAWLVMADQISPIRRLSKVETIWHNSKALAVPSRPKSDDNLKILAPTKSDRQLGQLFDALKCFHQSFSAEFLLSFQFLLETDSLQDSPVSTPERIQCLYDRSGYNGQVSDDDYNMLSDAIHVLGGFEQLGDDLFILAIKALGEEAHGKPQKKSLTKVGERFYSRGAQDTVQLGLNILIDIALLTLFMTVELEEDDLAGDFDGTRVYESVISRVKEYLLLDWLANTRLELKQSNGHGYDQSKNLLVEMMKSDWEVMASPNKLHLDELLTYWCRAGTLGVHFLQQYESVTANVMSNLLVKGELRHAVEFLKFMPWTPWTTYIRARLYLANSELADAATYFEEAAPDLVANFDVGRFDAAGLLQLDERSYFSNGHPRYYQHVLSLFEKAGAMSYVCDFASLALGSLGKSGETASLHTDLLSRLFTASIRTSRFTTAFETLTKYTDLALQQLGLRSLLDSLLSTSQTNLLLSLPFPPELAQDADAYLSSLISQVSGPPGEMPNPFATKIGPTTSPSAPHKILYAWRIRHGDFRGAALCLWEHLQSIKADQAAGLRGTEIDEDVGEVYLTLINCLSLVNESMAWILVQPVEHARGKSGKRSLGNDPVDTNSKDRMEKRRVVTLEDVRKEWQAELDRVADIEAGRYPLGLVDMEWDAAEYIGDEGDNRMEVDMMAA